jgi:hypothetical protein
LGNGLPRIPSTSNQIERVIDEAEQIGQLSLLVGLTYNREFRCRCDDRQLASGRAVAPRVLSGDVYLKVVSIVFDCGNANTSASELLQQAFD